MGKLKKLGAMLLVIAVTMTLAVTKASAVTYYDQAVSLDTLGLLRGTGYGYELDLTATRAEAATMLVRLLGKEQEALAGKYQYPFKDVPVWADKYVGYLYANGLTKGTSGTEYSPAVRCDTKMFTVFVLRSLGYMDTSGDFTYDGALDYATGMGLIDGSMAVKSDFLRGDMVAISYSALFQNTKADDGETLIDKLLRENAVDGTIGNRFRDTYAIYEEYLDAYASSMPEGPAKLQQNTSMVISFSGQSDGVTAKSIITIAEVGGRTVMKSEDEITYAGDAETSTSYYADGWVYTESGGEKFKYREEAPDAEALIPSDTVPFYLISSIRKSQNAGETEYNITYNPGLYNDMANVFLAMLGGATIIDIPLSTSALYTTFDASGRLKSQDFNVTLGVNASDGEYTLPLNLELQMRTTVLDTGSHITITLPADLDTYQNLDD